MMLNLPSLLRVLLAIVLVLSIGACSSPNGRHGLDQFQAYTLKRAHQAAKQGDLARSLEAYRVLQTLLPDDATVARRMGLLHERIQQRKALHQAASRKALNAGNARRARVELMKALALEPDNRDLLAALARIEANRVSANLRQRRPSMLDPAYRDPVDIERTLAPPRPTAQDQPAKSRSRLALVLGRQPGDDASRRRLVDELIEYGEQLVGRGKTVDALRCLERAEYLAGEDQAMRESVVATRNVYASRLYKQAVANRGRNPTQVSRLLRQALRLQPDFTKARLQLGRLTGAGVKVIAK